MFYYKEFSRFEREYWTNLLVNIEGICEKWDLQYESILRQKLVYFADKREIKDIIDFLGLKGEYSKSKLLPLEFILSNKIISIRLYCLWDFIDNKWHYFQGIYKIFTKIEDSKPYLYYNIIKDYFDNQQILLKYFAEYEFLKLGSENVFLFEKEINDIKFDQFLRNQPPKLKKFLNKNNTNNKEYYTRFVSNFNDNYYVYLSRESIDKIPVGIKNNKRSLIGKFITLVFDSKNSLFKLSKINKEELRLIKSYIKKYFHSDLIPYEEINEIDSLISFFNIIQDLKSLELKLVSIIFINSNLHDMLKLDDISRKKGICDSIKKLKINHILKLEKLNEILEMTFRYKGRNYIVIIEQSLFGQFKLRLNKTGLSPFQINSIKEIFYNNFSFHLDQIIKIQDYDPNINIYEKVTSQKRLNIPNWGLSKNVENVLVKLYKLKLIETSEKDEKRNCFRCGNKYWIKEGLDCPKCGSDRTRFIGTSIDININRDNIFNHFKKQCDLVSNIYVEKIEKTINKVKYQFILLKYEENISYIYLGLGKLSSDIIDIFDSYSFPIFLIYNKDDETYMNQIGESNFGKKVLYEILEDPDSFFNFDNLKQIISDEGIKRRSKISRAAELSYREIIKINSGLFPKENAPLKFELYVYNLFLRIFKIGDRLGINMSGTPAPDGIINISHLDKRGNISGCLAWDCKLSEQKLGYPLKDEVSKHTHYIHTIRNHKNVKFYGPLKAYAFISNNMNIKSFNDFMDKFTIRKWNGNILLIDLDAVIILYNHFNKNVEEIAKNSKKYYKLLFDLFFKKQKGKYIHISKKYIISFLINLNSEIGLKEKFEYNRIDFKK